MEPLITVIVPVYNVEKYLDRCIESIVNQIYENLEIILVDDGSPDNCPAMCDAWAEKDNRIKVIHKENGGVSSARNTGLDIAQGEYIGFVDSDDYIEKNMISKLYEAISLNCCDISICKMFRNENCSKNSSLKTYDDDILSLYLSDNLCVPGVPAKLYLSNTIKKLRFNCKLKVGEDYIFNFYAFKNSTKVVVLEDELYCYELRKDSAVNSYSEEMLDRWKNTKFILESKLLTEKQYSVLLNKYAYELACIARETLRTKNNKLINFHFFEIANEIEYYSKIFLKSKDIPKITRLNIIVIKKFPMMYKLFYSIYLQVKNQK